MASICAVNRKLRPFSRLGAGTGDRECQRISWQPELRALSLLSEATSFSITSIRYKRSIKGNVKRNTLPSSWRPTRVRWHSAPGMAASIECVCGVCDPIDKALWDGCHRPDGRFSVAPFPLVRMSSSERPAAVKGAPIGAAKRTLDGEDRSARMAARGKGVQRRSISETQQAKRMPSGNHDSI